MKRRRKSKRLKEGEEKRLSEEIEETVEKVERRRSH